MNKEEYKAKKLLEMAKGIAAQKDYKLGYAYLEAFLSQTIDELFQAFYEYAEDDKWQMKLAEAERMRDLNIKRKV